MNEQLIPDMDSLELVDKVPTDKVIQIKKRQLIFGANRYG